MASIEITRIEQCDMQYICSEGFVDGLRRSFSDSAVASIDGVWADGRWLAVRDGDCVRFNADGSDGAGVKFIVRLSM